MGWLRRAARSISRAVLPESIAQWGRNFDDNVTSNVLRGEIGEAGKGLWDATLSNQGLPASLLTAVTGSTKPATILGAPTWDELQRPGESIYNRIKAFNSSVMPDKLEPYAEPLEAFLIGAVNPYAGAAFHTAYQGGQQQALNKGFDWGSFGKDAAINFGTAGIADWAKNASQAANSARQSADTLSNFNAATNAGTNAGTSSALNATRLNAARNTQNAVASFGRSAAPALQFSNAANLASSGAGLGARTYDAAVKAAPAVANQALTSTLAPQGARPISGSFEGSGSLTEGSGYGGQWGDVLGAFGGEELNTPNPNGPRISPEAFAQMAQRLGANAYLQQEQARDNFLPTGQITIPENTPYANREQNIQQGTTQAFRDLNEQAANANRYYGIIDSNPGMDQEALDAYLNNPTGDLIGNFNLPQDRSFLQGIRPMRPANSSLLF